jgi:hypothetical protein
VRKVFLVIEQDFCNFQSIIKFIFSDKIESGDYGDYALPKFISINQTVKPYFIFFVQILNTIFTAEFQQCPSY